MTREIPYEQLNALQNPQVPPGRCVYMKGVAHPGPDYPIISETFTSLIAMAAHQPPHLRILFEYFPLSKATSVPQGATAFRRTEDSNALVLISWMPATAPGTPGALDLGDAEKGNTDKAREMAKVLTGILLSGRGEEGGLGYLNYGALLED